MNINVAATDANNIICEVTPTPQQLITIDRGVVGNGIASISVITIGSSQYLHIVFTNGTTSDVGPINVTLYTGTSPIVVNNTTDVISLTTVPITLGGTNATTAATAIQNLLPSYTGNASKRLGLNSGATGLEWVADGNGTVTSVNASGGTTGLTFSGGPVTTSGTLTLAGTLAIANGGTGQTTANAALNALLPTQTGNASKYLQTDGTNATWDAISLSTADITGILPTANGGTGLSSFTSGGVVYASSTSALATGSALTFNGSTLTLSASVASATLTSSGAYSALFFNNSGGATKAGTILTNSSGILQSRAETLTWTNYDASSEYMRLTSTGLGIGTTSPSFKLDVTGNIRTSLGAMIQGSSLTATASQVTLDQLNTTTSRLISWGANTSTAGILYLGTLSSNASVGSASALIIDASQNVGIGVTSPSSKLHVGGTFRQTDATISYGYSVDTSSNKITYAALYGGGYFAWQTNNSGADRMTLDISGNLLVGTTTNTNTSKLVSSGTISQTVGSTQYLVVDQSDIGTGANEIPLNQYLGALAYQDNVSLTTNDITGVLPTANGGTGLSSFTSGGVVYASSTSALATGSALTFNGTNLSSTGGATFQGSPSGGYGGGEVRLGSTTADIQNGISTQATGTPQLIFDHRGTSNTGNFVWRNGSGGANELMRLTSTGLGIGTSSPASKLHIESTSAESFRIGYSSTKTARLGVTSAGDLQIFAYDSAAAYRNILLAVDTTSSAGNVGIGTSSPSYKLDTQIALTGTAAGDNTAGYFGSLASGRDVNIRFGDSVNASARIGYLSGSLYMYTNGSERVRIDTAGSLNVGGNESSIGKVVVKYTSAPTDPLAPLYSGLNLWGDSSVRLLFGTYTASPYAAYIQASNTGTGFPIALNPSGGFVGIGMSAPQARFNVQYTDSAPTSSGTMTSGTVFQYSTGGVALNIGSSSGGYTYFNSAYANNAGVAAEWRLYQGATQAVTLNASGQLMLGTTSAQASFTIGTGSNQNTNALIVGPTSGTAAVGDKIVIGFQLRNTAGGNTGNQYAAAISGIQDKAASNSGALGFYTQAAAGDGTPERARIDSSGNFLLGVTSSTGLTGTGDFAMPNNRAIRFRNAANSAYLNMIYVDASNNLNFGYGGVPTTITFGVSGIGEVSRFDSSGYLLLGTTGAIYNSRIVVACASGTQSIAFAVASAVTRASGTQYGYTLYRDNTTETSAVTFIENNGSGSNAASYVVRTNSGTGGATITSVSGGVALVNGATSWSSYSDLRLKHDVVPVTNAIESILKIDPIFFKWNDRPEDQQRSIGVSAQSVEKVFPELIDRSGIYDVEGGAMQVRYTELIPVLLASIQEQQAIIQQLQADVAALKG